MTVPRALSLAVLLTVAAALPARAAGGDGSLRGSPESMVRQNRVAKANDYSFLRSGAEVRRFAEAGYLVRVKGDANYRTANVSFPYARPEVVTLLKRLGAQYRTRCGERMVVTSLTRPLGSQPKNAHELSVHPAGMAVDLRISRKATCRAWLEGTLLSLERKGLLDVTRERNPPHYHVAVFPDAYGAYVKRLRADSVRRAPAAAARKRERAATRRRAASASAAKAAATAPAAVRGEPGESEVRPVLAALSLVAFWLALAVRRKRIESRDAP
ncbi:MAG: DUF5715 family protein [Longimicrobiaceae bacterium]